uniref:NADH:ubiquinone reductase (H(+)-translocating) n=1 Tax=Schmidtea mediterranea TaxID=79327 RepID=A0A2Z5QKJ3_SCHMD|nr:NADH dehydrogenase subunit 5 [Schistosoma mattheei]
MNVVSVFVILFISFILLLSDLGGSVFLSFGGSCNSLVDGFVFHWVDSYSSKLILMLLGCSLMCFSYVFHYMVGEWIVKVKLVLIMISFSGVMLFLVLSGNFVTSLLFWEYLGLVSFILILYYGVWESYRGGVITLVSSRFGDVGLFLVVCYYMSMGGGMSTIMLMLMLWLVVITKSASFPFISWLLEAMRAPTPVSSLVHSSTLVAAGVWFYLNYYELLGCSVISSSLVGDLLLVSGLFSIFVSGVSALLCNDIKQLVALSTCSNISWVVVMMSLGEVDLALVQLVVHGLSKCVIFFLVGDYISSGFGGQMVNALMVNIVGSLRDFVYVFMLVLGLSGFPFIGLYFSKHLFLGVLYNVNFCNLVLLLVLYICVFLSVVYCARLISLFDGFGVIGVSSIRLFYRINWFIVMFSWVIGVYYSYSVTVSSVYLFSFGNVLILVMIMLGLMIGVYLGSNLLVVNWSRWLMGLDVVVVVVEQIVMWLSSLCGIIQFRWEANVLELIGGLMSLFIFRWYFGMIILNLCVVIFLVMLVM